MSQATRRRGSHPALIGIVVVVGVVAVLGWASPAPAMRSGPALDRWAQEVGVESGLSVVRTSPLARERLDRLDRFGLDDLLVDAHESHWVAEDGGADVRLVVLRFQTGGGAFAHRGLALYSVTGKRPTQLFASGGTTLTDRYETDGRVEEVRSISDEGGVMATLIVESQDSEFAGFLASELIINLEGSLSGAGFSAPFVDRSWRYLIGAVLGAGVILVVYAAIRGLLGLRFRFRRRRRPLDLDRFVDVSSPARAIRRDGRTLLAIQLVSLALAVVTFAWIVLWGVERTAVPGTPLLPVLVFTLTSLVAMRIWRGREEGRRDMDRAFGLRSGKSTLIRLLGAVVLGSAAMIVSMRSTTFATGFDLLADVRADRIPVLLFANVLGQMSFAVVALVLLSISAGVFRWSRRAEIETAPSTQDLSQPVVLLRSFGDDRWRVRAAPGVRRSLVDAWSLRIADRLEEVVAWELSMHGEVIAVEDPQVEQRPLGAARVQMPHASWREGVAELIGRARLLVVVIGSTDGLVWEIETIAKHDALEKTVFIVPPVSRRSIDHRVCRVNTGLRNAHHSEWIDPLQAVAALALKIEADGPVYFGTRTADEAGYRSALRTAALASGPTSLPASRATWAPPQANDVVVLNTRRG